jgi:uncharacterized protein (TIGR03435 family)
MRIRLLLLSFLFGSIYSSGSFDDRDKTTEPLKFEIVSIRPSNPKTHGNGTFDVLPNGIVERNNSLTWLVYRAYGLIYDGSVQNEPDWADEELFDVETKVAPEDVEKFQSLSPKESLHKF